MTERTYFLAREELLGVGFSRKAARQFEDMQSQVASSEDTIQSNIEGTDRLKDATFVTLSPNAELPNERVLTLGTGLAFELAGEGEVKLNTTGLVRASGGHEITLVGAGESEVLMPLTGRLATLENYETLKSKTLEAPLLSELSNAADDTAAASAGVPVGGMYRDGSVLMVRVA